MDPFLDVAVELNISSFEFRDLLAGRKRIVEELDRIGPNGAPPAEHEQRFDALLDRAIKLDQHVAVVEKGEQRSSALTALKSGTRSTPTATGAPAPIPFRGDEPEHRDLLDNVDGGKHRFSLLRAVDLVSRNKPLDGFEAEVSQEIEKRSGKPATGFYIPWNLPVYHQQEQRDAFSTTGGAGLIPKMQGRSLVDVLRNKMLMAQLGATVMADMVGTFDLPKKTATGGAYWLAESGEPTESNPTIGQINFAPTTVGCYSDVTRRLIKQSSFDAEAVVRSDLLAVLTLELDRVGFNGSGTSNQPQGILQNSSVAAIALGTNGGPINWAKIVELESTIAALNADIGNLAYVTSAKGRGACKTTRKDAGSGIFLWGDDNQMNGHQALATNQIPSNLTKGSGTGLTSMIFGNFADATYAMWGGIDVNVDTASLSKSGGVRIVYLADAQFKLRRTESFAKIVDLDPAQIYVPEPLVVVTGT